MAQARGVATAIQIWNETSYGVKPGSPSGERIYFKTSSVGASIGRVTDDTLSGRRGKQRSIFDKNDVQGTLVTTLAPQSCARLLSHLIGTPTITSIATAKQFVFSLANGLPAGFGMETDYGSAIATPGRFHVLNGCRIGKGTFKFGATGLIEASYDVRGAACDVSQVATADATPDDYGHTGFSMINAVLTEGGSPYADATDISLTWDNDLDDSLFVIGGGGTRGDLPEGNAMISGTLTALFKSPALLAKAKADTESSLRIVIANGIGDGTAGNESIQFDIPNLVYDFKSPPINGPKGIKVDLNFTAHCPSAAELAASVTLKAMRATA